MATPPPSPRPEPPTEPLIEVLAGSQGPAVSTAIRRRIGVLLDLTMAYDRTLVPGIWKAARGFGGIEFLLLDGFTAKTLALIDRLKPEGVIAHIDDLSIGAFLQERGIRIVDVSDRFARARFPRIVSDDLEVGRWGARHLRERGFAHYAFCGFTSHHFSDLRGRGFAEQLASENCTASTFASPASRSSRSEVRDLQFEKLCDWIRGLPKPVGIMACNDNRAYHIIEACHCLGLRVPHEVAVLGVDNDEIRCEMAAVPISSIALNTQRIGHEALCLLVALLDGHPAPDRPLLVPPWKIIGRQSTDVIAVEDKVVGRALHIIREEAAHDLSVGRLSDRLKISRRSLELRFRRALNRAPYDEILRVRLAHAQSLLAETDLDVSQVAEAAGFHDTRRLSLLFRQKLGLTPSDYRRQRRL